MSTTRLTVNPKEVASILPGLTLIVTRIEAARAGTYSGRIPALDIGKEIFAGRRYDRSMHLHLVAVRTKLAPINSSSSSMKVRLNCFEIAAAALALRVTNSSEGNALDSEFADKLRAKLEKHRKRAVRASQATRGRDWYKEHADNWRRFVKWLRHDILYRPRRKGPRGVALLRKQTRVLMRSFTAQVVVETVNPTDIQRWAALASRELRRGRHNTTLLTLLKNADRSRQFLAEFILKRASLELLRPEFRPVALRACFNAEKFAAALVNGEHLSKESPSIRIAGAEPGVIKVASAPVECVRREKASAALKVLYGSASNDELIQTLAAWLSQEVETEYWESVCQEIKNQVWHWSTEHKAWAESHQSEHDLIRASKPDYQPTAAFECINYYAEWAARWLFVLNPDPAVLYSVTSPAYVLACQRRT